MEARGGWRDRGGGLRTADGVAVLACLVLAAFAAKGHWTPLPRPVILSAGAAGSLAQYWRRRWPLLAAAAGVAAYPLSGNPRPILLGLYAGAVYAPRRWVWAVGAAGGAAWAGWSWIVADRLTWGDAVSAVGVAVLVTAGGLYVATRQALTESRRARAELAESEQLLREDRARAAERTRIAREMHDVLAHKVSLIAVHAGALELVASGQGERLEQGAALIRVTARQALQELRYVLGVLRDEPGIRPVGSPEPSGEPLADLPALVTASRRLGQRAELRDRAGALPMAMARVVYRVVQEGLTNAHKHAPDAPVVICVERGEAGAVTVTVDNASSSRPPLDLPGSGAGLIGLAERVRLAGGVFSSGPLSPEHGGGWRLHAVLPWFDHHAGQSGASSGKVAD
jgi:signal transduction histidine kinase